jgi:tRNA nucleotidyltransferase (CCA-adding enzyme)
MLEAALNLLKKITAKGYKAYIVGGFVRDYILGIESNDIDVNTNATPKELKEIFTDSCLPIEDYGSVTVMVKGIRFEITTFRREIKYIGNRKPIEIEYIDDLEEDLKRRDFTINTICMDDTGKIIDLLGGEADIKNRLINTVGDPNNKFSEDALRILRAVRFATQLDFKLTEQVKKAITLNKDLLRRLSYNRKKEELDKIFASSNSDAGIKLLLDLGLDKPLELANLNKVTDSNNLIGIWAVLDVVDKYPFTNNEKELISNVKEVMKHNNLDPYILYRYGLYVNTVAGELKGLNKKDISANYQDLIIHRRKDLDIDTDEIMKILERGPGNYLNTIYLDIEQEVLYRRLPNKKENIITYIVKKYGN